VCTHKEARDSLNRDGDLTLLHCTSAYPTPYGEANLSAIETIRNATGCHVGWSDHTVDPGVIHRAIHRWGASAVEFHLDLDGTGEEYATGHCWLPDQISDVIRDVNHALDADGTGIKEPSPSELPDREWRADPSDGLRPSQAVRKHWIP
jgi:sialic acid synthase SpsE